MRTLETAAPSPLRLSLRAPLIDHEVRCNHCRRCVVECAFLKKYGDPGELAAAYDPEETFHQGLPFECSLCGLCTAVCPEGLDPSALFLEMRRESVARGKGDFPEHKGLVAYERKGTSRRFSWYALPEGCTTIFFPGCALPGTRPERTRDVFDRVRERDPKAGIVLDCCTKPSHDLGREEYFRAMFGEMKYWLLDNGVQSVLVACPNCYRVFKDHGGEFEVRSIYEFLAEEDAPSLQGAQRVSVHDPCVIRFDREPQEAVRTLLARQGVEVEEAAHSGRSTLCCGEGGAVGSISPELARIWTRQRAGEAGGKRIVTSCAGCAHLLGARTPTSHILDLVFDGDGALAGKARVSRAPFTYLNRLRLKKRLKETLPAAITRERTFTAGEPAPGGWVGKTALLAFVVLAMVAVRASGLTQYLDQDQLRALIAGTGVLGPLIYMALYAIAPALFLPGLPLSIAGGILFGPLWGVIYTIFSATAGACVAFLVSRHLARGWIEGKLRSPRWRHLDEQVEKHGWKMVAFTRLIPLFPFNLLNYAFGLTRVKFSHYALATFVFMLPGCIAFIVFSSSLLEVLQGRITPTFLLGLALMVLVSLIPLAYRRHQARRLRKVEESPSKVGTQASSEPDSSTHDLKRSLARKGIFLLALGGLALLAWALVRHYFWALNAHLYTAEFHLLFQVNNLKAGNLALFTDYFRSLGAGPTGLAFLCLAEAIQGFWLPLSPRILTSAFVAANGLAGGGTLTFLSFQLVGLLAFGLGRFLFGDLLPLMGKGARPAGGSHAWTAALALLTALPWIPLPAAPLLAGLLRWSPGRILGLLLLGGGLRLLALLVFPGLFA